MQFKDAAYEVLKEAGKPLHYKEITNFAFQKNILKTKGQTPQATMGALLYTDTLKENSRFRRGDEKGTFALKAATPVSIRQQIEGIQDQVRKELQQQLFTMHPQKFEELIRSLLEVMGFDEAETTAYANDKGVDVRGILRPNALNTTKVAVQAKRAKRNVGPGAVRDLRGSLGVAEQGLIITSSDFTRGAKRESQAQEKKPITLINGSEFVDLLIQYQVGVKHEQFAVPSIDTEYWAEVLELNLEQSLGVKNQKQKDSKVDFPVEIRRVYKGKTFIGELLDIEGRVRFEDQEYRRPTTAAKVIVTDWKEVNGWDFWRYRDPSSGDWEKIGKLR
jgi:restriction system protein